MSNKGLFLSYKILRKKLERKRTVQLNNMNIKSLNWKELISIWINKSRA